MITRIRQTRTAMYAEIFGVSLAYVATIAGFAYQIARSAGIA